MQLAISFSQISLYLPQFFQSNQSLSSTEQSTYTYPLHIVHYI